MVKMLGVAGLSTITKPLATREELFPRRPIWPVSRTGGRIAEMDQQAAYITILIHSDAVRYLVGHDCTDIYE